MKAWFRAYTGSLQGFFTLSQNLPSLQASPFFDRLVFSKVAARLGGNVKAIVNGGAPLSTHVEEFLRASMCCPVVQVSGRLAYPARLYVLPGCPGEGQGRVPKADDAGVSYPILLLQILACPGAPLNPRALHSSPPQGYGLTETCAASFIASADLMSHCATVGPPTPCTEFR